MLYTGRILNKRGGMMYLYRIILIAEDGAYTLRDGYTSMEKAEYVCDQLESNYGEGQRLVVEMYANEYIAANY